eukprot:1858089-Lingulodinium_polyedra.AAC.1
MPVPRRPSSCWTGTSPRLFCSPTALHDACAVSLRVRSMPVGRGRCLMISMRGQRIALRMASLAVPRLAGGVALSS